MDYILLVCLVISMVSGILQGINDVNSVKVNPKLGVKESKNLFTFLFLDN